MSLRRWIVCLVVLGLLLLLGQRLGVQFGRMSGDIYIRSRNATFYFPIVTCILLGIVLSLVLWLFRR